MRAVEGMAVVDDIRGGRGCRSMEYDNSTTGKDDDGPDGTPTNRSTTRNRYYDMPEPNRSDLEASRVTQSRSHSA